jgi:hypothetical protein
MSPPIGILKGYFLGAHLIFCLCLVLIKTIFYTKRSLQPFYIALVAIFASTVYYEFDVELISKSRDRYLDLFHCVTTVGMPCFWTQANPSIADAINDKVYNEKLYYPGLNMAENEQNDQEEEKVIKCGKLCIFVICHDDSSCSKALSEFKEYSWARIYRTPDKNNHLLEGYMHKVALWKLEKVWMDSAFVGTISYNVARKINMVAFLDKLLSADPANEDVVYFLPGHGDPFGGHAADERVRITFRQLLSFVGLPPLQDENHVWVFCNFWMARPAYMRMYLRFFTGFWLPALEAHPQVWEDSVYRDATLSKEKLLALTGKPYYPLHTFINERLPSVFFTHVTKGARISCPNKLLSANYGPAVLDWILRFGVMSYFTPLQGSSIIIGEESALGPSPLPLLTSRLKVSWLNQSAKVESRTYNQGETFFVPLFSDMI